MTFARFALTLTYLLLALTATSQIPTNGLVAHWPFTGNVNDAHGTHHGNANNIVPAQGKMGMNNTAYQFNHANAFIGVPYQSDMNMSAISMCAILKPNAFYTNTCQGNYVLIRGTIGSSGGYFHGFSDNAYNNCNAADTNLYVFSVHVGPITMPNSAMQSNTKVHTGSWYCVVMTYDSGTTKIYVDGALVNTTTGWSTTIGSSTDSICIGKFPWGGPGFPYNFNGVLDDIAIYNRALTQSEIDSYCTNAPLIGN
ncbi:MAG: LamG domain-containing protein, partial [Taibaiella sp.]|nr:LamG domain-containing protein [Taibaiella sp.]